MTRVIKFRVWDTERKVMHGLEGMCFYQDKTGLHIRAFEFEGQPDNENELLLQYTGFQDRYGNELWEGDLVINPAKVIWEVDFHDGKQAWRLVRGGSYEEPFPKTGFNLTYSYTKQIEKIGNIYENPDLLALHDKE